MPGCSVAVCNNYTRNTKGSQIIYHCFPKDKKLRKVWVDKCKRRDSFNPDIGRVCSVHFSQDDYERDMKAELLGLPPKKILKPIAIPSLHLNSSTGAKRVFGSITNKHEDHRKFKRTKMCTKQDMKRRAVAILKSLSPKKKFDN